MLKYSVVTERSELRSVAQKVHDATHIGFDIETAIPGRGATFDPILGKIRLVQLNIEQEIFVLDLWRIGHHEVLLEAMRTSKAVFIIHNAKFEQKWFWHHYRFEFWPLFDTLRASGLIYNGKVLEPLTEKGKTALDLDSCVKRELNQTPVNVGKGGSDWSGTLSESQLNYAAEDVLRLPDLYRVLRDKLKRLGLFQVATLEFAVALPEATCELNGLPVDQDAWKALAGHHRCESRRLAEELFYELPHPKGMLALPGLNGSWNLNSPDQLLQALHRAGCHVPDTSRNTLAMQAGKFGVLKKVLEHRTHTTRLKMFGDDWLGYIHPKTGRVHTSYYSLLASGRYSSSDPNLQQIPREKRYRACFKAPPGKVFIVADYAGIEMRLVAEVSGDERLIKVFQDNQCAHYSTASLIMQKPIDQITAYERQMSKPVNFGFCYGMREKTFVLYAYGNYGVAMTLQQAKKFRKRYFEGYRGVAAWHSSIEAQCEAGLKMVRTMSGRIRFLDPKKHHNEYKNCLDAKTQALTKRGWVYGLELLDTDEILTKSAETGELEWHRPLDLRVWRNVETPLVEFRSRSFNAVSTPNHRWLVSDRKGNALCRTSDEISLHGDHKIHRTGFYPGAEKHKWNDDFVEFVGWLVTDGSLFPLKRRRNVTRMVICQSQRGNPEKVARIDRLVSRIGWGHSRHYSKSSGNVSWVFRDTESELMCELFPERTVTVNFLTELTRAQLLLLREVMLLGDGTQGTKESFYASSENRADIFQILCVLTGKAASVKKRDMRKYKPKKYSSMGNVPKSGVHYVTTIQRRTHVQVKKNQRRDFVDTCSIWCPIVPNTYFVARREGQVFITGNTPIQGTGADGLKLSLRNIHDLIIKNGYEGLVKPVHHVHDEIILEADDDPELIVQAKKDLELAMRKGMAPFLERVPIKVDAAHGSSWAEAK